MTSDPHEAMYFDKAPVAHVVQYRDRERAARISANMRSAMRAATGIRMRGKIVVFC